MSSRLDQPNTEFASVLLFDPEFDARVLVARAILHIDRHRPGIASIDRRTPDFDIDRTAIAI